MDKVMLVSLSQRVPPSEQMFQGILDFPIH